jgi:sec-independent protein translocase protein TatB
MFDIGIGFSELMLLAVIVIIVVGPEELPSLLRTVGRYVGQVKRIADDFRAQVDDAIKDPKSELDELRDSIGGVTENLDDDPFGEESLIDFEEHNKKILEDEQKTEEAETATQKALRESGVSGLESPSETELDDNDDAVVTTTKVQNDQAAHDDEVVLTKKSGT